jgi:hypothetical protein
VRFCTSWGTTEAEIDGLIGDVRALAFSEGLEVRQLENA